MSNPFTSSSNDIINTVNNKKPNYSGNVTINISDIPTLQSSIDSLSSGIEAKKLSQLVDVSISNPQQNQTIMYNNSTQNYQNKTIDHYYL